MTTVGIISNAVNGPSDDGKVKVACSIDKGILTIGNTSAKIYNPATKTKIPETLFYDTNQVSGLQTFLRLQVTNFHTQLVFVRLG